MTPDNDATMEILNQPFSGHLGDRLIELLDSPDYRTLNIIVAFAKNSGILRIKDALERFRKRGGVVHAYVGVDLGGTSYEALTTLLQRVNSLYVVHSEHAQTFHTKIYDFVGDEQSLVIIGSHNLTGGGLWANFENSVLIPVPKSSTRRHNAQSDVEEYISNLTSLGPSFMPINTQNDIEELLDRGYILKEVAGNIRRATQASRTPQNPQEGSPKPLFGNGVPVKLPRINPMSQTNDKQAITNPPDSLATTSRMPLNSAVTSSKDNRGDTIWFETRAMTGGSRNILDLSMKSLVAQGKPEGTPYQHDESGFMRGGVEFFNVDPSDTAVSKDIVINFDGIDYFGNTILFPHGNKANGTWRLQIKGVATSGAKITDALKAHTQHGEEHYLVRKILAFTKVQSEEHTDDYYFMSVMPETDLDDFKAASWILAYNGATAHSRMMGLLKAD